MLERTKSRVEEERSTRRTPLTDTDARALLATVDDVLVARGRSIVRLPAKRARLADLRGPTGNYRAPMLRHGRTLLVGFHPETLERLLAG